MPKDDMTAAALLYYNDNNGNGNDSGDISGNNIKNINRMPILVLAPHPHLFFHERERIYQQLQYPTNYTRHR